MFFNLSRNFNNQKINSFKFQIKCKNEYYYKNRKKI